MLGSICDGKVSPKFRFWQQMSCGGCRKCFLYVREVGDFPPRWGGQQVRRWLDGRCVVLLHSGSEGLVVRLESVLLYSRNSDSFPLGGRSFFVLDGKFALVLVDLCKVSRRERYLSARVAVGYGVASVFPTEAVVKFSVFYGRKVII